MQMDKEKDENRLKEGVRIDFKELILTQIRDDQNSIKDSLIHKAVDREVYFRVGEIKGLQRVIRLLEDLPMTEERKALPLPEPKGYKILIAIPKLDDKFENSDCSC